MFCTFFLVSFKERVKIIGYKQVSPIYYSRGIQWKFYGFSLINKQIIPISCRKLRRTILISLSAHMFIHIKIAVIHLTIKTTLCHFRRWQRKLWLSHNPWEADGRFLENQPRLWTPVHFTSERPWWKATLNYRIDFAQ